MTLKAGEELNRAVWLAVHQTPAADVFTVLGEADLLSSRALEVDALLGEGAPLAALFRRDPRQPDHPQQPLRAEDCREIPLAVRAELVWRRSFLAQAPLDEAGREALTSFGLLGAGAATRDLDYYRGYFRKQVPQELSVRALQTANLSAVALRRDLFSAEAAPLPEWLGGVRILRCLGLDALGADWSAACARLKKSGLPVKKSLERDSVALLTGLIAEKSQQMRAQLVSYTVAQPQELTQKKSGVVRVLGKCVLPFCAQTGLPLVLRLAGRGVAYPELFALCAEFPGVRLLLSGSGAEQLTAGLELAREFPSVLPLAGCGLGAAATAQQNFYRQGLELLGGAFAAFASGAEHLLQMPGRWAHARWLLGEALQERFAALARTGWGVTEEEVRAAAAELLNGQLLRVLAPADPVLPVNSLESATANETDDAEDA